MSNKSEGTAFEREFCDILAKHRFWVHNLAASEHGQPADVIALRDGKGWLIDCKVCSTPRGLAFSRIEENQHYSMLLWCEYVKTEPYFACKLCNGQIYMLPLYVVKIYVDNGKTAIDDKHIRESGMALDEWIENVIS